jgi:hypothetical protein
MAVNLSPYGGVGAQFLDNSGNVLTGGKIFTYAGGTTTPQATYTSSNGATPHPNPIILDAAGRVPGGEIWLTDGLVYKFILRDANDVLIATYDGITGINSNFVAFTNQQEIQTATAGQTIFNLTTMQYQPGTNSLSVFVDGVNQYGPGAQYAYLETDSDTVTFVNGLHVGAEVKFTTSQLNTSGSTNDAFQVSYTPPFTNSVATNVGDKLSEYVSVKDFGAVGNGTTDDTTAIQAAIDSNAGIVFFPEGTYKITQSIIITNQVILQGVGKTLSTITLYTSVSGTKAIDARAYRVSLQNIGLTSNSGNSDGLALVGFFHSIVGGGSVGRNDHNNIFISGFSDAGMRIEQAISYSIKNADINCGDYCVHITRHSVTNVVSTTVTLENVYTSGGNQGGIYLDSVATGTLIRCVMEFGGDVANANSAAFVNALSSTIVLYGCYFEANYRDIYSTSAFVQIGTRHGVATVPDVYTYNVGIATTARGLVEISRNRVLTRYLTADTSFRNYIEVEGDIRSTDDIITESANLVAQKALVYAGSYNPIGRADDAYYGSRFAVNASTITNRDIYGPVMDLGVSYSGFAATGRWMRIQQRMDGNSNHKLEFIRMTGTFYEPTLGTESTALILSSSSLSPGIDSTYNLGSASLKWNNVYAANGTIITSDKNQKQQIRSLSEKELAVAKRVKGLIKAFKFNDAVAEKGAAARIHFGVIAQEVQDAFSAEGLNADEYGIFCKDTWYEYNGSEVEVDENNKYIEKYMAVNGVQVECDDEGKFPDNAVSVEIEHETVYKERLGIRYDELLAFVISAL